MRKSLVYIYIANNHSFFSVFLMLFLIHSISLINKFYYESNTARRLGK